MSKRNKYHLPEISLLDITVLVLSLYILVALVLDTLYQLPPETKRLLHYTDNAICVVFLIDFCIKLYQAPDKWQFMRWGWIDLLASIPNVEWLRVGRLLQIVRILRIIRAFRSVHRLLKHLYRNKAEGTFNSALLIAVLLLLFSSVAILQVENHPDSNIRTAEDAIWWAYVTITTVGYGDRYPVTTEGRLIAVVLMTAGVGLFGTFTAWIASWFVEDKTRKPIPPDDEDE